MRARMRQADAQPRRPLRQNQRRLRLLHRARHSTGALISRIRSANTVGKRWSGYLPDTKGRVFHSIWDGGPPDARDIEAITAMIDSLSAMEHTRERRNPDGESVAVAQRGASAVDANVFDTSD